MVTFLWCMGLPKKRYIFIVLYMLSPFIVFLQNVTQAVPSVIHFSRNGKGNVVSSHIRRLMMLVTLEHFICLAKFNPFVSSPSIYSKSTCTVKFCGHPSPLVDVEIQSRSLFTGKFDYLACEACAWFSLRLLTWCFMSFKISRPL